MTTIKPLKESSLFALSAYTIDEHPNDVKAIIKRNGINLPNNTTKKDIDKAYGVLLLKSPSFRRDFSKLAASVVADDKKAQQMLSADGQSYFLNAEGESDKTWQDYFTPELVSSLIKTAADTAATKIKGKGGTPAPVQPQLDAGRNTTGGTQPININMTPSDGGKGIGTGGIIAIAVSGVALLGTVLYFALRKK